jgi:hypothetical protein
MVSSLGIEDLKDAANRFFGMDHVEVIMLPSDMSENVKNPVMEQ